MTNFTFRKSSYSDPQRECVEVATNVPAVVAVRDSTRPGGAVLRFPAHAWRVFGSSRLARR